MIKTIARLPYHAKTWVGFGHTIANGYAEESTPPYAENTALCAAAILPSSTLAESAWNFRTKDGEEVFFWAVVPLHLAELEFKMQHGIDPLLELFDRHGVTVRIDPGRPSVVPK